MTPEVIKKNLNKRVQFISERAGVDSEYILSGAIFRRNEQGFFYQAELQDVKHGRHIIIARLEEIKTKEGSE